MSKTISQESFNMSVKENMDLFDMPLEEAIIESKQQFESMGVNLYNIVTDESMIYVENNEILIKVHPVIQSLRRIKNSDIKSIEARSTIDEDLNILKTNYHSDIAYRLMGAKNEGQEILENILKHAVALNDSDFIENCLTTFTLFLVGQPDVVNDNFLIYLVDLLKSDSLGKHCISLIFKVLSLCCFKHEGNREVLINEPNCIIPICINQLNLHGSQSKELTKNVCSFIRHLILDDDVRVAFGRGMENAKSIVTETNCLDILLRLCKEYKEKESESVVAELFFTLDKLSIRNEFCQRILDLGGLDYILQALENHINSQLIVTSSLAVLKSLAANDKVKVEIGKRNGLGLIMRSIEIHIRHQNTCCNGFGALSAVSLKTQNNCRDMVKMGLPQLLRQGIEIHLEGKHFNVLRPICLTTRNVVVRCPELKIEMLEAGLEELLNNILKLGRECDDEAKAALRDLGCNVELKELWTGKVGVKVQQ